MNLSDVRAPKGQVKKQKRVGQGMGSRRGKFSGRGAKGAKSVSGYSLMRGFEGGQMPLHRRLPKRGFKNIFRKEYTVVNVGRLNELEGDTFDFDSLKAAGTVKKLQDGLKVLGDGEITRPVTVTAHVFSATARQKIEAAGGKVNVVGDAGSPS
jgi:large subunit ribosomal protein L15